MAARSIDVAEHLAGQGAVDDFEFVGDPVVQAQVLGDGPEDLVEAAGHHGHRMAGGLERRHELGGALAQLHLGADGLDDVGRQPGEHRHPGVEALGEVQFPAHGGLGHGRHFLALAGVGGQQFDDFLLDQRGVHVHDQELPRRARAVPRERWPCPRPSTGRRPATARVPAGPAMSGGGAASATAQSDGDTSKRPSPVAGF